MQIPVVAITGHTQSTLARHAQVVLSLGNVQEAGDLALAPTTSTTMMLALGDALALVTSQMRQFRPEDFKRFHPGGSLGRRHRSRASHTNVYGARDDRSGRMRAHMRTPYPRPFTGDRT